MIAGAFVCIKTRIIDGIVGTIDQHGFLQCRLCEELTRKIAEADAELTRLEVAAGEHAASHIRDNVTSIWP